MTRATATSLANELPPVSDIEFSARSKGARRRQLGARIDLRRREAIEERPGPALGRPGDGSERRAENDRDLRALVRAALAEAIVGPDGSPGSAGASSCPPVRTRSSGNSISSWPLLR